MKFHFSSSGLLLLVLCSCTLLPRTILVQSFYSSYNLLCYLSLDHSFTVLLFLLDHHLKAALLLSSLWCPGVHGSHFFSFLVAISILIVSAICFSSLFSLLLFWSYSSPPIFEMSLKECICYILLYYWKSSSPFSPLHDIFIIWESSSNFPRLFNVNSLSQILIVLFLL